MVIAVETSLPPSSRSCWRMAGSSQLLNGPTLALRPCRLALPCPLHLCHWLPLYFLLLSEQGREGIVLIQVWVLYLLPCPPCRWGVILLRFNLSPVSAQARSSLQCCALRPSTTGTLWDFRVVRRCVVRSWALPRFTLGLIVRRLRSALLPPHLLPLKLSELVAQWKPAVMRLVSLQFVTTLLARGIVSFAIASRKARRQSGMTGASQAPGPLCGWRGIASRMGAPRSPCTLSWRNNAKLAQADAGVMLHEAACKALQTAAVYDQLNIGELASMEILARSIQMTQYRWKERILGASSSMHEDEAFLFLGSDPTRGSLCIAPSLNSFIGQELAKEALASKEQRQAREERTLLRGQKK